MLISLEGDAKGSDRSMFEDTVVEVSEPGCHAV